MSNLNIFEIERFAIHDGPGIRTTVFFQGCALHCLWCANPESQTVGKHIMFFKNLCGGCGRCVSECRHAAIHLEDEDGVKKSHIDRNLCVSCGRCAAKCLNGALKVSGQVISEEELFDIVLRDRDYYAMSNGGITLSGGEAILQTDALIPVLEKCRDEKIHVAVETCGYVPLSNVETALEYVDLFLFDIKTLDKEDFQKYTGGNLDTVIEAFEYLCKNAPEKIIVRVPVIPEFNDDKVDVIIKYAALHGIKEAHLLPYHTLGISKYYELGQTYRYPVRQPLNYESLVKYVGFGEKLSIKVKIGG